MRLVYHIVMINKKLTIENERLNFESLCILILNAFPLSIEMSKTALLIKFYELYYVLTNLVNFQCLKFEIILHAFT